MAFLTLNGVTIPVNKCEEVTKELGGRGRVFSGAYHLSRRASKRSWKFATPPVSLSRAEIIKGMVRGTGNCWRFDDGSLYDAKGVTLDAAGSQFTSIADLTALDDKVKSEVIEYGRASVLPEIEAARGSVRVDRASENMLGALQRRIQAASAAQFSTVDATNAASTDHTITGTHSLKVVTSAVVNAVAGNVYSNAIATTAARFVTGSVWVYSAESDSAKRAIDVVSYDATAVEYSTTVRIVLEQDKWTRVTVPSFWRPLLSNSMHLVIAESVADSNITFYADGWQIEEHATEVGSTAWVDGARAAGDVIVLDNANFFGGSGDFTFNFWASNSEHASGADDRYAFGFLPHSPIGGYPYAFLYRDNASQIVYFGVWDDAGVQINASEAFDFEGGDGYDAGQMHMLTCVIKQSPASDEYNVELWCNGVFADGTNGSIPNLAKLAMVGVGRGSVGCHYNGANQWGGAIDDFAVLPFAADAATIAAWYANGQYGNTPKHTAAGDFVRGASIDVIGELHSASGKPHSRAGTWANDAQVVAFTLHEV